MKFDKSRVYTALNADELKVGSKVIVSDKLKSLKEKVEFGVIPDTLTGVRDESHAYRFAIYRNNFALAYLVEEPAKLKWTDLKVGDIIQRNATTTMVTRIDNDDSDTHVFIGGRCIVDEELEKWQKIERSINGN